MDLYFAYLEPFNEGYEVLGIYSTYKLAKERAMQADIPEYKGGGKVKPKWNALEKKNNHKSWEYGDYIVGVFKCRLDEDL